MKIVWGILCIFAAVLVCAQTVVILPSDAIGAEKTAAEELRAHLKIILGRDIPLLREGNVGPQGRKIYLGRTKFASRHVGFSDFGPEESQILSVGSDLIITGGRPRGTLYGVYEFLERAGKVVWLDEKTSHIPVNPALRWEKFKLRTKPVFRYRGIYTIPFWTGASRAERLRFLSRCRENIFWEGRVTAAERERWGITPVLGRPAPLNTMHFYSVHWPAKGMDSARSLNVNGKRDISKSFAGPGQICFSSPLARKTVAEQLKKFIAEDRKEYPVYPPLLYNLSINDTHDRCECKTCVSKARKYGSYAGTVLEFVNFVADAVKEKYPEIRIQTSAYLFTEKAPQGITARDNVIVRLSPSPWGSKCQTMTPLTNPVNKRTLTDMKKWSRSGKIHVWNYWVLFGNYAGKNAGVTGLRAVTENLRLFHELGSDYVFSECEFPDTASFHNLRLFLGYRLLRDPHQDVNALLDLYFRTAYGPAGAAMRRLFDYQEKRQAAAPPQDFIDASMRPWLDAAFFRYADQCLKEAEKAAGKNTAVLARIRQERVPLDIARLSVRTVKSGPEIAARLKRNWNESQRRCFGKNIPPREAENLKAFLKKISSPPKGARYPLPAEVSKRVIYDITWQEFSSLKELASYGLKLVDDPEAAGGKAMCIAVPLRTAIKGFHRRDLQAGVFSRSVKKPLSTKIFTVKSDEKYHFYKMGQIKFHPVTLLYIHRMWYIQQLLERYYITGEPNEYEVWFSLKARGKTYCKTSVHADALFVDRILLLAPEKK